MAADELPESDDAGEEAASFFVTEEEFEFAEPADCEFAAELADLLLLLEAAFELSEFLSSADDAWELVELSVESEASSDS